MKKSATGIVTLLLIAATTSLAMAQGHHSRRYYDNYRGGFGAPAALHVSPNYYDYYDGGAYAPAAGSSMSARPLLALVSSRNANWPSAAWAKSPLGCCSGLFTYFRTADRDTDRLLYLLSGL